MLQVATTANIRLLGIEQSVLDDLFTEHPYYSTGLIPSGAYRGVEDDVTTLAVMNWVFAMEDLEEDVVTTLLNIFADDRVSLEQVHDMARQIDLDLLASPPIPLLPAVERWLAQR